MDSVVVFQAEAFDDAFERALELGRELQKDYTNRDGQRVVWRLAEVISIDIIRHHASDWAEVYSEPVPSSDSKLTIDSRFHPESSTPTQTL